MEVGQLISVNRPQSFDEFKQAHAEEFQRRGRRAAIIGAAAGVAVIAAVVISGSTQPKVSGAFEQLDKSLVKVAFKNDPKKKGIIRI